MKASTGAGTLIFAIVASTAFAIAGAAEEAGKPTAEPLTIGEQLRIHSEVLDEDRILLVAVPDGYEQSAERYPVLYVLDGEWHFVHAQAAVSFLSQCGHIRSHPMPAMIVVGVVNVDRNRDYTPTHRDEEYGMRFPTSGHSDRFLEFIKSELIPFVDRNYRTQPYRILSGWSFGGLFCVNTLLVDPDVFDAYIAISPSLWWDDGAILELANAELTEDAGQVKSLIITLGNETSFVRPAVIEFVNILKARAPETLMWDFQISYAEDHNLVPPKALFDGLRLLYSDWVIPDAVLDDSLQAVADYYRDLSGKYGYEILIPEDVLTRLARSHWYQYQNEEALAVCELRREVYPERPSTYYFLGAAYENLGNMALAVEFYQKAYDLEAASATPNERDLRNYLETLNKAKDK